MAGFSFFPSSSSLAKVTRELITRFEKKIQTTLARVWGEEPVDTNSGASSNPSTGVPFEVEMPEDVRQSMSLSSAQ